MCVACGGLHRTGEDEGERAVQDNPVWDRGSCRGEWTPFMETEALRLTPPVFSSLHNMLTVCSQEPTGAGGEVVGGIGGAIQAVEIVAVCWLNLETWVSDTWRWSWFGADTRDSNREIQMEHWTGVTSKFVFSVWN